jgi:hypothetical protein
MIPATSSSAAAVNSITIAKTVVGTAPSGTTFTVSLDCGGGPNLITFDATGQATSLATYSPLAGQTCAVSETSNGGASSVAYACVNETPSNNQVTCSTDGASVVFGDTNSGSATITVTNTFETPTTTTTTTQPPQQQTAVAPAAVEIDPTFTG